MKCLTYLVCFWFTLCTCGCASQRRANSPERSVPVASAADAPPAVFPPPTEHRPLREASDTLLNVLACPAAITLIGMCFLFGWPILPGC